MKDVEYSENGKINRPPHVRFEPQQPTLPKIAPTIATSHQAARAWRVLASAGGGRAALLLAPERMDESLEDLTWQARLEPVGAVRVHSSSKNLSKCARNRGLGMFRASKPLVFEGPDP